MLPITTMLPLGHRRRRHQCPTPTTLRHSLRMATTHSANARWVVRAHRVSMEVKLAHGASRLLWSSKFDTDSSAAPPHEPPPPPPSFPRPHMPPPSSPQQHQQQHPPQPQTQRAPFPSFAPGRDLAGRGPSHRPGSSMSISSLIGGDTASSDRPPQSQSSPSNAPVNNHGMQPPSPRRGHPSGSRPDFQPFQRQTPPERIAYPNTTTRAPEGQGYPAGSPPRPYSNNYGSPEQPRAPLPQTSQPYKPMRFQSSRQYTSAPNDPHARDPRSSGSGVPPRPNSQPSGPPTPSESESRPSHEGLGGQRVVYTQHEERRRTLGESHHSRPNTAEIFGGGQNSDRDRPMTVQPLSHSPFSPPRDHRDVMAPHPPVQGLWRQAVPEERRREPPESRREDPPPQFQHYGGYPPASQVTSSYGNPTSEEMVRGRSLDHLSHRVVEQYHAPPTSDPNNNDRQKAEELSRSLSTGGGYPNRPPYDQSRRMMEEMQSSKPYLGLGPEASKRTGRASPLPQAVQGAQAQPLSIGKDPSIKSEFGRMFSGLGIGPPSRQSPMPQNGTENIPPGVELHDIRLQRVNSQNGRKPKRVKDEESMVDSESADGRGTPSMGARGPKRNKLNPPNHHHHHHTHTHQ